MPRVRCHRRGKQNPPASIAQTETPRNSSRLENSPGIRSEIVPLPLGAPSRPAACGRAARLLYIIWGYLRQRDKHPPNGYVLIPDRILDFRRDPRAVPASVARSALHHSAEAARSPAVFQPALSISTTMHPGPTAWDSSVRNRVRRRGADPAQHQGDADVSRRANRADDPGQLVADIASPSRGMAARRSASQRARSRLSCGADPPGFWAGAES